MSRSSRRSCACPLAKLATSAMAVTNRTEWPAVMASRPSAIAKCVLPTPGGPSSSTFSPLATQRAAARSRLGIHRRLGSEVEARQFAHIREVRDFQSHFDTALVLPGNLALAQQRQSLAQREIMTRRLLEHGLELVC